MTGRSETYTVLGADLPTCLLPSGPAAAVASSSQVNLTWVDNSNNNRFFRVTRRIKNADGTFTPFELITSTGPNAQAFSSTALTPGTQYHFGVRACAGTGCSPQLAVFATTPP